MATSCCTRRAWAFAAGSPGTAPVAADVGIAEPADIRAVSRSPVAAPSVRASSSSAGHARRRQAVQQRVQRRQPIGADAGCRRPAALGEVDLDGAPVVRIPAQLDESCRFSAFTTRTPPEWLRPSTRRSSSIEPPSVIVCSDTSAAFQVGSAPVAGARGRRRSATAHPAGSRCGSLAGLAVDHAFQRAEQRLLAPIHEALLRPVAVTRCPRCTSPSPDRSARSWGGWARTRSSARRTTLMRSMRKCSDAPAGPAVAPVERAAVAVDGQRRVRPRRRGAWTASSGRVRGAGCSVGRPRAAAARLLARQPAGRSTAPPGYRTMSYISPADGRPKRRPAELRPRARPPPRSDPLRGREFRLLFLASSSRSSAR